MENPTAKATFSIPSLIAIVAAIASFASGAFWGLVLALIAILFGVLGLVMSLSARTRGGVVSVMSILAAVAGIGLPETRWAEMDARDHRVKCVEEDLVVGPAPARLDSVQRLRGVGRCDLPHAPAVGQVVVRHLEGVEGRDRRPSVAPARGLA